MEYMDKTATIGSEAKKLGRTIPVRPRKLSDLPTYRNALLLQGPVGGFFHRLAKHLKARGSNVSKVNFNGGDDYFFPKGEFDVIQYRHKLDFWPSFATTLLSKKNINAVFLFGDCRPIHKPIISICRALNIDVWVFEEGYYRPHFFTLEYFGVNFHSPLAQLELKEIQNAVNTDVMISTGPVSTNTFWHMAWAAVQYWMHSQINNLYPDYDHHRSLDWKAGKSWIRSFFCYWKYQVEEFNTKKTILEQSKSSASYFLLALQLHDDAQIHTHSDFSTVEKVIEEVVSSFAMYGAKSKDQYLIIKHHPMGRGSSNYKKFIQYLSATLGIEDQVLYIHDIRLPALLPFIKGFVTVNSTLGLQALYYNVPVITLGRSFFNKPGITYQGNLDDFWGSSEVVDAKNVALLRNYIICNSQVEGSLYTKNQELS